MKGLLNVFDSTMPHAVDSLSWVWSLGIILGEVVACLIITFCLYYFSGKKICFVEALQIAVIATVLSFGFGVLWWISIGFW